MLGVTRINKDYQTFVLTELRELSKARPDQIREYQDAISKMLILNLDPLIPIISPLYPPIGRPAEMQFINALATGNFQTPMLQFSVPSSLAHR